MADIQPFKATRYDDSKTGDISKTICPPYDVISPEYQRNLYETSPYNFIRIEWPINIEGKDRYLLSAETFNDFEKAGILKTDNIPAYYLHDHYFKLNNKIYCRRNLFVRVKLEEWNAGIIKPHENTLTGSKIDRLKTLQACKANTSPILALYDGSEIYSFLKEISGQTPIINTETLDGERHVVWAINDNETLLKISESYNNKSIYIADGHHRYESALNYKKLRYMEDPNLGDNDPINYVMMALVDFEDPGLFILPPHRLIKNIPRLTIGSLLPKLATYFEITELSMVSAHSWIEIDALLKQPQGIRFAIFGFTMNNMFVFKLRDLSKISHLMPGIHSDIYKKLDVSVVDHVIIENILGMKITKEEAGLAFNHDREDAVNKVKSGEFQLAIILNPVKSNTIKGIADAGDRMPRKSTYFYPKSPAGLITNRLI